MSWFSTKTECSFADTREWLFPLFRCRRGLCCPRTWSWRRRSQGDSSLPCISWSVSAVTNVWEFSVLRSHELVPRLQQQDVVVLDKKAQRWLHCRLQKELAPFLRKWSPYERSRMQRRVAALMQANDASSNGKGGGVDECWKTLQQHFRRLATVLTVAAWYLFSNVDGCLH